MSATPEADRLRATYERKRANGLVDVKFGYRFLSDLVGVPHETLCAEVNALHDAIETGKARPFSFGDGCPGR